uniref:Titin n=1 Tax=Romanomermis culicivorax TaxID=13658 RepID=A0A915LAM2_ROMCU
MDTIIKFEEKTTYLESVAPQQIEESKLKFPENIHAEQLFTEKEDQKGKTVERAVRKSFEFGKPLQEVVQVSLKESINEEIIYNAIKITTDVQSTAEISFAKEMKHETVICTMTISDHAVAHNNVSLTPQLQATSVDFIAIQPCDKADSDVDVALTDQQKVSLTTKLEARKEIARKYVEVEAVLNVILSRVSDIHNTSCSIETSKQQQNIEIVIPIINMVEESTECAIGYKKESDTANLTLLLPNVAKEVVSVATTVYPKTEGTKTLEKDLLKITEAEFIEQEKKMAIRKKQTCIFQLDAIKHSECHGFICTINRYEEEHIESRYTVPTVKQESTSIRTEFLEISKGEDNTSIIPVTDCEQAFLTFKLKEVGEQEGISTDDVRMTKGAVTRSFSEELKKVTTEDVEFSQQIDKSMESTTIDVSFDKQSTTLSSNFLEHMTLLAISASQSVQKTVKKRKITIQEQTVTICAIFNLVYEEDCLLTFHQIATERLSANIPKSRIMGLVQLKGLSEVLMVEELRTTEFTLTSKGAVEEENVAAETVPMHKVEEVAHIDADTSLEMKKEVIKEEIVEAESTQELEIPMKTVEKSSALTNIGGEIIEQLPETEMEISRLEAKLPPLKKSGAETSTSLQTPTIEEKLLMESVTEWKIQQPSREEIAPTITPTEEVVIGSSNQTAGTQEKKPQESGISQFQKEKPLAEKEVSETIKNMQSFHCLLSNAENFQSSEVVISMAEQQKTRLTTLKVESTFSAMSFEKQEQSMKAVVQLGYQALYQLSSQLLQKQVKEKVTSVTIDLVSISKEAISIVLHQVEEKSAELQAKIVRRAKSEIMVLTQLEALKDHAVEEVEITLKLKGNISGEEKMVLETIMQQKQEKSLEELSFDVKKSTVRALSIETKIPLASEDAKAVPKEFKAELETEKEKFEHAPELQIPEKSTSDEMPQFIKQENVTVEVQAEHLDKFSLDKVIATDMAKEELLPETIERVYGALETEPRQEVTISPGEEAALESQVSGTSLDTKLSFQLPTKARELSTEELSKMEIKEAEKQKDFGEISFEIVKERVTEGTILKETVQKAEEIIEVTEQKAETVQPTARATMDESLITIGKKESVVEMSAELQISVHSPKQSTFGSISINEMASSSLLCSVAEVETSSFPFEASLSKRSETEIVEIGVVGITSSSIKMNIKQISPEKLKKVEKKLELKVQMLKQRKELWEIPFEIQSTIDITLKLKEILEGKEESKIRKEDICPETETKIKVSSEEVQKEVAAELLEENSVAKQPRDDVETVQEKAEFVTETKVAETYELEEKKVLPVKLFIEVEAPFEIPETEEQNVSGAVEKQEKRVPVIEQIIAKSEAQEKEFVGTIKQAYESFNERSSATPEVLEQKKPEEKMFVTSIEEIHIPQFTAQLPTGIEKEFTDEIVKGMKEAISPLEEKYGKVSAEIVEELVVKKKFDLEQSEEMTMTMEKPVKEKIVSKTRVSMDQTFAVKPVEQTVVGNVTFNELELMSFGCSIASVETSVCTFDVSFVESLATDIVSTVLAISQPDSDQIAVKLPEKLEVEKGKKDLQSKVHKPKPMEEIEEETFPEFKLSVKLKEELEAKEESIEQLIQLKEKEVMKPETEFEAASYIEEFQKKDIVEELSHVKPVSRWAQEGLETEIATREASTFEKKEITPEKLLLQIDDHLQIPQSQEQQALEIIGNRGEIKLEIETIQALIVPHDTKLAQTTEPRYGSPIEDKPQEIAKISVDRSPGEHILTEETTKKQKSVEEISLSLKLEADTVQESVTGSFLTHEMDLSSLICSVAEVTTSIRNLEVVMMKQPQTGVTHVISAVAEFHTVDMTIQMKERLQPKIQRLDQMKELEHISFTMQPNIDVALEIKEALRETEESIEQSMPVKVKALPEIQEKKVATTEELEEFDSAALLVDTTPKKDKAQEDLTSGEQPQKRPKTETVEVLTEAQEKQLAETTEHAYRAPLEEKTSKVSEERELNEYETKVTQEEVVQTSEFTAFLPKDKTDELYTEETMKRKEKGAVLQEQKFGEISMEIVKERIEEERLMTIETDEFLPEELLTEKYAIEETKLKEQIPADELFTIIQMKESLKDVMFTYAISKDIEKQTVLGSIDIDDFVSLHSTLSVSGVRTSTCTADVELKITPVEVITEKALNTLEMEESEIILQVPQNIEITAEAQEQSAKKNFAASLCEQGTFNIDIEQQKVVTFEENETSTDVKFQESPPTLVTEIRLVSAESIGAEHSCTVPHKKWIEDIPILAASSAETAQLEKKSKRAMTQVIVAPLDTTVEATVSSAVQLTVKTTKAKVDMIWKKDGKVIRESKKYKISHKDTVHILEISNLNHLDAGVYSVKIGNEESKCQLHVLQKLEKKEVESLPELEVFPRAEEVEKKKFRKHVIKADVPTTMDVVLLCKTSRSDIQIVWLKDSTPIMESQKYKIVSQDQAHELHIKNAQFEDAGIYCAESHAEKSELTLRVFKKEEIGKFFRTEEAIELPVISEEYAEEVSIITIIEEKSFVEKQILQTSQILDKEAMTFTEETIPFESGIPEEAAEVFEEGLEKVVVRMRSISAKPVEQIKEVDVNVDVVLECHAHVPFYQSVIWKKDNIADDAGVYAIKIGRRESMVRLNIVEVQKPVKAIIDIATTGKVGPEELFSVVESIDGSLPEQELVQEIIEERKPWKTEETPGLPREVQTAVLSSLNVDVFFKLDNKEKCAVIIKQIQEEQQKANLRQSLEQQPQEAFDLSLRLREPIELEETAETLKLPKKEETKIIEMEASLRITKEKIAEEMPYESIGEYITGKQLEGVSFKELELVLEKHEIQPGEESKETKLLVEATTEKHIADISVHTSLDQGSIFTEIEKPLPILDILHTPEEEIPGAEFSITLKEEMSEDIYETFLINEHGEKEITEAFDETMITLATRKLAMASMKMGTEARSAVEVREIIPADKESSLPDLPKGAAAEGVTVPYPPAFVEEPTLDIEADFTAKLPTKRLSTEDAYVSDTIRMYEKLEEVPRIEDVSAELITHKQALQAAGTMVEQSQPEETVQQFADFTVEQAQVADSQEESATETLRKFAEKFKIPESVTQEVETSLTVQRPDVHILSPFPSITEVELGKDLILKTTTISSEDKVVWSKAKEVINESLKYKIVHHDTEHELHIRKVSTADIAIYTIKVGKEETATQLQVKDEAPKFLDRQKVVRIEERKMAKLTVETTQLIENVQWFKDGIKIEESPKYGIESEGYMHHLTIQETVPEDQATYTAEIGIKQCTIQLIVEEKPLEIVESSPQEVSILEGQLLELVVGASKKPKIVKWYKDGRELTENENIIQKVNENVISLIIKNTRLKDAGAYSCLIDQISVKISLSVIEKLPEIILSLKDEKAAPGQKIELLLTLSKPGKQVKWYKNGQELKPTDRVEILDDNGIYKLVIGEVASTDVGLYVCQVDDVSSSAELSLLAKPEILLPEDAPMTSELKPGQELKIKIPFSGQPVPEVTWTFNEETIIEDSRKTIVTDEQGTTLIISNVSPTDMGQYQVKVENEIGIDVKLFNVHVLDETVILKSPENVVVKFEHQSVELAVGLSRPNVEVQWFKDQKILIPRKDKIKFFQSDTVHKLVISDVESRDAGTYSVLVNQKERASAALSVEIPATINLKQTFENPIMLKVADTLSLSAMVSGSPTPEVQWLFNEKPLDSARYVQKFQDSIASLTIQRVEKLDSVTFTLVAENEFGGARAEFVVEVQDVPSTPKNLTVDTVQGNTVTLSWQVPEQNKEEIAGFVVEKQDVSRRKWVQVSTTTDTSLLVKDLLEHNAYLFRVSAFNRVGKSLPVTLGQPVVAEEEISIPSAPSKPTVTIVAGTCLVTWDRPSTDGKSPITGFVVAYKEKTALNWNFVQCSTLECSIANLPEEKIYEFKVTAVNAIGRSEFSPLAKVEISKERVPVPPKLERPSVMVDSSQTISISWSPPSRGSAVLFYRLEYREESNTNWTQEEQDLTATFHKVRGLRDQTSYVFRVCAVNESGAGEYSDESKPIIVEKEVFTFAPEILEPLEQSVALNVNEEAIFSVKISGRPKPVVKWYKNGHEIRSASQPKMKILITESVVSLIIESCQGEDQGEYECEIINELGCAKTSTTLQIKEASQEKQIIHIFPRFGVGFLPKFLETKAPKILVTEETLRQTLIAGQNVKLRAEVHGLPKPEVIWYKNGRELIFSESTFCTESDNVSTLVIENCQQETMGSYQLVASNESGSETVAFELIVK